MHYILSVSPEPPYLVSINGPVISKLTTPASLRLTCYASGTVERYEWYRSGSKFLTTSISYYRIPSAQPSDTGYYQCTACNWAGCSARSSSYTVTVIGWFTQIVYHVVNSMVTSTCISVCAVCKWCGWYRVRCHETPCIFIRMEV